ncbi:hypothetical protein UlMin_001399 [Ulmus minor]
MEESSRAVAEQLGLRFSSMNLSSNSFPSDSLGASSVEEEKVFYDDDGLVADVDFGCVVVVDDLPVVGQEGVRELESEIRELFAEFGDILINGFSMPLNPRTLETMGRCFIEYPSRQQAMTARDARDGYQFGKSLLSVYLFGDRDSLSSPVEFDSDSRPYVYQGLVGDERDFFSDRSEEVEESETDLEDGNTARFDRELANMEGR